ncbi:MAG: flagellar motor protein MotB [Alphaproteobacteria bacterium]
MADEKQPIIIKKVKKGGHGHHGGAWKVAYADFVTAMMAFFLLLWLLNATSVEQKVGLANYFAPVIVASTENQAGGDGALQGTSIDKEGAGSASSSRISADAADLKADASDGDGWGDGDPSEEIEELVKKKDRELSERELTAVLYIQDEAMLAELGESLLDQIAGMPDFKDLTKQQNLSVKMAPDGLEITLSDTQRTRLFNTGSERPFPSTVKLIQAMSKIINRLPNKVSITGHTDSTPYRRASLVDNWDLSSRRAHASRRILARTDFDTSRLAEVAGRGDSDPLFPENRTAPENRRITFLIQRQHPEELRRRAEDIHRARAAANEGRRTIFDKSDVPNAPTLVPITPGFQ